ncbi:YceI family protein [Amycolatopsis sp. NPDC101161]|uniref:YceI family protein n=1 Tax=Amycolatopsis sp. NPDC101161 TaxID=3363940 RepID=UPI003830AC5C
MPDTEVLPAVGESPPGAVAHTLRRDRCVVEPSIRLARLPVLRGRLTATGGHFDVDGRQFVLVLDATSLRPSVKLLRRALTRALRAGDHPDITFTSEDIEIDPAIDITGKLDVAGATRELHLRGDLRHVDDDRIVLWAKGTLPAPRRKPRGLGPVARLLAARRIHLEIAAEFVR